MTTETCWNEVATEAERTPYDAAQDAKTKALLDLRAALAAATASGLLDDMAADLHPDSINAFCDAATSFDVLR